MKIRAIVMAGLLGAALAAPAFAQLPFPGGGGNICGLLPDTDPAAGGPCYVQDTAQDNIAEIMADEDQELLPGLAGGFDASQALSGDLEQQVSSAGGMPLIIGNLQQYPQYWPGYTNASYVQNPAPGSPEADSMLAQGTLWGALNAGAKQQQSQQAENQRLVNLEGDAAAAFGNLQVQEVGNEIALFQAQQDMKLRNAINGDLNAMLVVESNRVNKEAQDNLTSMAEVGDLSQWDPAVNPPPPDPQLPSVGQ